MAQLLDERKIIMVYEDIYPVLPDTDVANDTKTTESDVLPSNKDPSPASFNEDPAEQDPEDVTSSQSKRQEVGEEEPPTVRNCVFPIRNTGC